MANGDIATTTDAHLSNGANINASGNVSVQSQFTPSTDFWAGTMSGAFIAAFGGSEVEVTLSSNTNASATTSAVVAAGGGVTIGADSNANSLSVNSAVGGGAIVAANAAIASLNSSNSASATIASGAAIRNATSVTVDAQTFSKPVANAYGVVAGIVAAGGTSSTAIESGTTNASIDGGIIGGGSSGQQVGSLSVSATATAPVDAQSWAGGLAAVGATINSATATAQPTVNAAIDDGASIKTTGDVDITSDAETGANTYVFALSIGVATAGLSRSNSTDEPAVTAEAGAAIDAGGNINVQAFHNANGGAGAQAGAESPGISIVGYAGADPNAAANASVASDVTPSGSLSAGENISISSNSNNAAVAQAFSLFAGALGAGTSTPGATVFGSTQAQMNGSVTGGASLSVDSQASNSSTATGESVSGGLLSGLGVASNSNVSPTTVASIGDGIDVAHVSVSGDVNVVAQSADNASAQSQGVVGGIAAVGIVQTTSTLTPTVQAFLGSNSNVVSTSGNVTFQADQNYNTNGSAIGGDGAHATSGASGGGVVSVENSHSNAVANANVSADADAGSTIDAGGDVEFLSNSENSADATSHSASGGVVDYGGVEASSSATGTTAASLDGMAALTAGGGLQVIALGTNSTNSYANADSGGVANIDGADTNADSAPDVTALASGTGAMVVGGTAQIVAAALGSSSSESDGAGGAILQIGTSHSESSWDPNVQADIGGGTSLTTGGDLDVQAFNNYDTSGNPDASETVQSTAHASGGGVASIEGAEADLNVNSYVLAHIGAGADLSAGDSLNVDALSLNMLQGSAGGSSGGVFGDGSVVVNASMTSNATAVTDDSSASDPTQLSAGNALNFLSDSSNDASVTASGGAGGLVGVGSAQATVILSSPVSFAGLGDNTIVDAPAATMQIMAMSNTGLQANANQSVIGGIASNETDATALLVGGQTTANVGSGVSVNVRSYTQIADDTSVQISANSNASVPFDLAGTNTANSEADAHTDAKVHLGSGSTIIASANANFVASADNVTTVSNATTSTTGLTGELFSNAGSNKNVNTEVDTDPGSSIQTSTLIVMANHSSDGPSTYVRNPQTNANTVVEVIGEVVHTVCEIVGQVVCLWGLICNPDTVCNTITTFITTILGGKTQETTPGSESVTNSVNFNSDVTITGDNNHTFIVNPSGTVVEDDGVAATDGTNPLQVGDTVSSGEIVVNNITNSAGGQVEIEAPEGTTSGSSNIVYDAVGNVNITNNSANNLYVNNIDLVDSSSAPPAITQIANFGSENWTYTLTTGSADGVVNIANTSPTNNVIVLEGYILNPSGPTTIDNAGGSILAGGPGSYVRTRVISLESDGGSIGTASQSIPLQLIVNMGLESSTGVEQADGYSGVYLDVVTGGMDVPLSITVSNVYSAQGNVDLTIEDGQEVAYTVENVVTLDDGTVLQGFVLMHTGFNPATAVNAADGVINLGYVHSLTTGESVTYQTNGGEPIGGLIDGAVYQVKVVDPTSVELGATFDPAADVDGATSTIDFGYDPFLQNGQAVVYDDGGGPDIDGLVNGQTYYVHVVNTTTVELAQTEAQATAQPVLFDSTTAVNSAQGQITFGSPDGFTNGEAVTYQALGGVPIQGLTDGDIYYVIVVNPTTIELAATQANATASTPVPIAINAMNATGEQGIGDFGIPLQPDAAGSPTQFLQIVLDPSVATGTNQQLVTNSFYMFVNGSLVRVQNSDVASSTDEVMASLTPEGTTVVLQNVTAAVGNVTISAGTTTQAQDNLDLTGLISSPFGTTTISTLAGNIINDGPGELISAQTISLSAPGGAIGTAGAPIQVIVGSGDLNANAQYDIYVTEESGALPVGTVTSTSGDVGLTVPISGPSGNDLLMGPSSSISAGGAVTLLVADNVTMQPGSTITAGATVLIEGDYGNSGPGIGSTITIAGAIYAPTATVEGGDENDTINLTNVPSGTKMLINTGGGTNVVNIGSLEPQTGGVVNEIQGPLTVEGSGSDTMNADDSGSTTPQTGTLTQDTLTGLMMGPAGITYSGLSVLNVFLGTGGLTGNVFDIAVASGFNLPAVTTIYGGSADQDSVNATWGGDFNGVLNLFTFADTVVKVGNNFNGTMTDTNPGAIRSISIGGSLTSTGVLDVLNASDPAYPKTPSGLLGDIGTMTVGGSIAGLVQVSGNIGTLDVGPPDTPTTGDVNDVSGRIVVGGALSNASISGNVSGSIQESLTINALYIGGSLTSSGVVDAINSFDPAHPTTPSGLLGDIGTMTVGGSIAGLVQVSGNIGTLDVGPANTPTAGDVNDVSGHVVVGGALSNASISGIVSGLIQESLTINTLYIGESLTATGVLDAINASDPTYTWTPLGLLGDIGTMNVGGSISGLVQVSGNVGTLDVGPANTPTAGDVNDVSGRILVGGALSNASISGNVSGLIQESLTINTLYIGGSLTAPGVVDAINAFDPTHTLIWNGLLGDIGTMTVGGSIAGLMQVSGNIGTLTVGPANTPTTGDVNDVSGRVLVGGALSSASISGNVSGLIQESLLINTLYIGGSLTSSGVVDAVNTSDPIFPWIPSGLLADIGTMTVGGSIAGLVQVSGNVGTLDVGPLNTPTTGDVNDVSGRVLVGGALSSASISGNVSGSIQESLTINMLYIGGALTPSGTISAVNFIPAFGDVNTMTVQGDLAGQLTVSGTLESLTVHGGTPGTVVAGLIGTIADYGGYGPVVAQIKENGTQRLIEATLPSAPFPTPAAAPAATPAVSPLGITFQYFYEGLDSPAVENLTPPSDLVNPQLTIRVANQTGNTACDQFDLSLVVYNDSAKFNLARLDATGNSGVSGIGNVSVEGNILSSVTAAASKFFAPDSDPAGIYLPKDNLAGVGVRDYVPNRSIDAKSIQAVAFGSMTASNGQIVTGGAANNVEAAALLVPGTAIVQAGSTNGQTDETFRVPFADLQQVGFFMDDVPGSGAFDNANVALVVESVSVANFFGSANIVTPSNVARGAVIALITVAETFNQSNVLQNSAIQTISLRGDGGSISTRQTIGIAIANNHTKVPFTPSITSTGPLGDVIIQGQLPNVTAPSIFGSLLPSGSIPATTTIQTTGIRIDPITSAVSEVPADLGRVYVVTTPSTEVTTTQVLANGSGLAGQIICGGNLISQVVSSGATTGSIDVQPVSWEPGAGNLGAAFQYPFGQPLNLGGFISNGSLTAPAISASSGTTNVTGPVQGGTITVYGSVIGNITINGSMNGPTITAGSNGTTINVMSTVQGGDITTYGSLIGNVTITGAMDGPALSAGNGGSVINLDGSVVGGFITTYGSVFGSISVGGISGPTASAGYNGTVINVSAELEGGSITTYGSAIGSISIQGAVNEPLVSAVALQSVKTGSITVQKQITVTGTGNQSISAGTNGGSVNISVPLEGGSILTGGNLGNVTIAGALSGEIVTIGTMSGSVTIKSNVQGGLIATDGSMNGNLSITGSLIDGEIVSVGNVNGNVTISGGLQSSQIAALGSILGNLTIVGTLDSESALVSGGSIGGPNGKLSVGDIQGIVAAVGSINVGKIGSNQAIYYKANDTGDASAIDEVFSLGLLSPLSSTDLFDHLSLLDLDNVGGIVANLDALAVKNGKLVP